MLLLEFSYKICLYFLYILVKKKVPEVKLNYFLLALKENAISEVILRDGIYLYFKGLSSDKWYFTNTSILPKKHLSKIILKYPNIDFSSENSVLSSNDVIFYSAYLIFLSGIGGFYYYNNLWKGKDNAVIPTVRFIDICGHKEIVQNLKEVIYQLKNANYLKKNGIFPRKGILLYGPPGTGKTMFAKAFAGESGFKFISVSGAEFINKYVGTGPNTIKTIFESARKNKPCIIFIDEFDALGKRENCEVTQMEYKNTINQLLKELDGFEENDGIFVIAATNHIHNIDKALIRSQRFDLKIKLNLPNNEEIHDMLLLKMNKLKYGNNISDDCLKEISNKLLGKNGADIQCIVNELGFYVYERNKDIITDDDLNVVVNNFLSKVF